MKIILSQEDLNYIEKAKARMCTTGDDTGAIKATVIALIREMFPEIVAEAIEIHDIVRIEMQMGDMLAKEG